MKIIVNRLSIEVTRKCNLRCDHCLRGEPQAIDIDPLTVHKITSQIHSVTNDVTLTGGEPLLLSWLPQLLYRLTSDVTDMEFWNLYIATNGTVVSTELIEAFDATYTAMHEEFHVQISNDQYHEWQTEDILVEPPDYWYEGIDDENFDIEPWTVNDVIESFSHFPWMYEPRGNETKNPAQVYNRGRAEEFSLGQRPNDDNCNECKRGMIMVGPDDEVESICGTDRWADSIRYEGKDGETEPELHLCQLYISANGNVQINCNHSFDDVDEDNLGNIREERLEDILTRHYNKIGYDESHRRTLCLEQSHLG